MEMTRVRFAALGLLGAAGCNSYDMFRLAGYQQESFTNSADVLFVVDNSDSMLEETSSLAENFAAFVQNIAATEAAVGGQAGLPDAVDNYVHFVEDRSAFVDFQFAVTTTDAQGDKGEALGSGVVPRSDPELVTNFIDNVLCEGACFEGSPLPTDDSYECGEPFNGSVSSQYVECACGSNWQSSSNCGSADESGLEAVFLAMCRAVEAPPVACFEDYIDADGNSVSAPLDEGDIGSNEGLIRPGANFVPVVITDEGDSSPRTAHGESIPEEYLALYSQFNVRMTWVTIGPTLDEDNQIVCPGAGSDYGVARYAYVTHVTNGRFVPIDVIPACITRDFEGPLNELGDLLNNLLTVFPLQSVPVPGTLTAVVDGNTIDESVVTGVDAFGLTTYSDGWSYRTVDNSVEFHGSAIPDYNADVQIFYLPVDGMPRELPF
jgi:hypothetical protein